MERTHAKTLGEAVAVILSRTVKDKGCWIYQGKRKPSGYALFSAVTALKAIGVTRRWCLAHQYVARLFHGPCPSNEEVMHLCHRGTEGCVRPDHLRYGTRKENMEAMGEAGRTTARWSDSQIRWMRHLVNSGSMTQRELSRRWKCSQSVVSYAINGQRYKWVV